MKRSVRRLPALILAAGVLTALAACTPPVTNLAGCEAPYGPGDNSNAVTATGKVGSEPKVDFPTPLVTKDQQVSVLTKGDGAVVYPTNTVEYFATLYDAATGEPIPNQTTGYEVPARSIVDDGVISRWIQCASAGSRLAVVATTGSFSEDDDIAENDGDTVVAVVDIVDTYLGKANGWDQLPQAGMPSVVLAPDGQPGVITPNEDAPTEQKSALLKAGTGATVKDGDTVIVQYVAIPWGETTVSVSTWTGSAQTPAGPLAVTLDDQSTIPVDLLVGQKVGSQVLAVLPANGDTKAHILVIDILKIED